MHRPRIVILGAGYGGIMTTKQLQKLLAPGEAEVTLVNKHDYHYFTTNLHLSAAGSEHPDQLRVPIKTLLSPERTSFKKAHAIKVLPDEQVVLLKDGTLPYDYLVIAVGAKSETFGIPGLKQHALTIQSLNRVRYIYRHIRLQFATYKNKGSIHDDLLTIVIGGAGLTGIEFVGELMEQVPLLCKEFDIDPAKVNVYCVQSSTQLLSPGFDPELVQHAKLTLSLKGVRFKLSAAIQSCSEHGVQLANGEFIPAKTIVWTGGIQGNYLLNDSGFPTVRGRVQVQPSLQTISHPNIFIIGDCSIFETPSGEIFPPTAQIAIQQGYACATNLVSLLRNKQPARFDPQIKGTVASIGKGEAVGMIGDWSIKGPIASLVKKFIDLRYIYLLGGVKLIIKKKVLSLTNNYRD